jgi:hypothetical protein
LEPKVKPFKIKNMKNLVKAVVAVSSEVRNIEKNLNVGTGNFGYKGIADKDVKNVIGKAMIKNGLAIFPVKIEPTVTVEKWEEETTYNKKTQIKRKQSVFTEVVTTYKLYHESGESIELQGYGHGVDSQDKSAGKATTYALKYTLLYNFMVATGSIDDSDTSHSDDIKPPIKTATTEATTEAKKKWITPEMYEKAKKFAAEDLKTLLLHSVKYKLRPEQKTELERIFNEKNK